MSDISKMMPFLIPLIILQLGLQISALVSLVRREKVKFNNKFLWAAIIILGQLVGSIVYFIFRGDEG